MKSLTTKLLVLSFLSICTLNVTQVMACGGSRFAGRLVSVRNKVRESRSACSTSQSQLQKNAQVQAPKALFKFNETRLLRLPLRVRSASGC